MLELLNEPTLPLRERAALLDAAVASLGDLKPFEQTLVDLCAAAYGGAPKKLAEYRARRANKKDVVVRPESKRVYRFLRIVMVQAPKQAPRVVRVVRADTPMYRSIHIPHPGGGRLFVVDLATGQAGPLAGGSTTYLFRHPRLGPTGSVVAEGYLFVAQSGGRLSVSPFGDLLLYEAP